MVTKTAFLSYNHKKAGQSLLPDILEEMKTMPDLIAEYPAIDSLETCLKAALEFATKNRRAILHIYNSVNRDIFEQYLWKVCQHIVSSMRRGYLQTES